MTLHDQEGRALHTIRNCCMPDGDPDENVNGVAGDVLALRGFKKDLPLAILNYGEPEMHRWLDGAFRDEEFGVVLRLIDFWHLLEKLLTSAAVIVPADGKNALVARWGMALLNRSSARATILEELRASKKEDIRLGDTEPVHDAITYLVNDAERMDFAATRRNRPIGCGAVEATARAWWPCEWGAFRLSLEAGVCGPTDQDSRALRCSKPMELTLQAPAPQIKRAKAA